MASSYVLDTDVSVLQDLEDIKTTAQDIVGFLASDNDEDYVYYDDDQDDDVDDEADDALAEALRGATAKLRALRISRNEKKNSKKQLRKSRVRLENLPATSSSQPFVPQPPPTQQSIQTNLPPPEMTIENFLVFQLLQMNLYQREQFLVQLAIERGILIDNKQVEFFDFHPALVELPPQILDTRGLRKGAVEAQRFLKKRRGRDVISKRTSLVSEQVMPMPTLAVYGTQPLQTSTVNGERSKVDTVKPISNRQRKRASRKSNQSKTGNHNNKHKDSIQLQLFPDQVNHLLYGNTGVVIEDDDSIVIDDDYQIRLKNVNKDKDNESFETPENQENLEKFIDELIVRNIGYLVEGEIRLNAKNFTEAYVPNINNGRDVLINSMVLRQCSLHGDIVQVFVKNIDETTTVTGADITGNTTISLNETVTTMIDEGINPNSKESRPVGFVVKIIKKKHSREAVGSINLTQTTGTKKYVKFIPRDLRVPKIRINLNDLPSPQNNEDIRDNLYMVRITEWINNRPIGVIVKEIGRAGNLAAENQAILLQNGIDIKPFPEGLLQSLPKIPDSPRNENHREDLTDMCIFTIDPATAKDLDDALSCRQLENGNFEVGVHISDVSYYIPEESELDNLIKEQATSVYLVSRVYHMLPEELCLTCSLLPGVDRLAMSVFWEMTPNAEIVGVPRFTRSTIRSCVKLAYAHAQMIIDNPTKEFNASDFPPISSEFQASDISRVVLQLQRLAVTMRQKRFANGALRIDQAKISFNLDENGDPESYYVQESSDSNWLVEEFMLLANGAVAKRIHDEYPNISILRNHAPPRSSLMNNLVDRLSECGIKFDTSTSKMIRNSIDKAITTSDTPEATSCVLNHLTAKQMIRARYV